MTSWYTNATYLPIIAIENSNISPSSVCSEVELVFTIRSMLELTRKVILVESLWA